MRFAVLPSIDEQLNDEYFKTKGKNDTNSYFVAGLKNEIKKRGDEIHTIDKYDDLKDVDYIIVNWPRWAEIRKIILGKYNSKKRSSLSPKEILSKMIYVNAEPTSVLPINSPNGYETLKQIFPIILTWNREWTDDKSIFRKNIPYPFYVDFGHLKYEKKKLLTAITADKYSNEPGELYSERRKVYSFFEKNYPDDFDFYGIRWHKEEHPGYKGTVADKASTFQKYKFAICLENTKGDMDYVTEKIYDCLCAGIVPIYGGAKNISEYVPSDCYIDYFSFESYEEMAKYISEMPREEYDGYISRIKAFLENVDKYPVSIEKYVEQLYDAISKKNELFKAADAEVTKTPTPEGIQYVKQMGLNESLWNKLVEIKHKYWKKANKAK